MISPKNAVGALVTALLSAGLAVALAACSISAAVPGSQSGGEADPNAVRVAFYGDSYTLGTGAKNIGNRWSTVVCDERGWSEFNVSANGLGFINNRTTFGDGDSPSLVIAQNPDIVFITMGLNDNFSFSRSSVEIHDQITADLDRLKAGLPEARFIVVEPFWYTDDRPDSVGIINGWVKDAATQIGADYIPDASHWIEGHPEWMASDGLHPNDAGYAAMTKAMDAALEELGLPAE